MVRLANGLRSSRCAGRRLPKEDADNRCMFRRYGGCLFVAVGCSVPAALVTGGLFERRLAGGIVVAPFIVILPGDHAVGEAHGLPVPELKEVEQVHVGIERAVEVQAQLAVDLGDLEAIHMSTMPK